MRAAGCFNATEVVYTGNRFDRARGFSTDTQNITESIPLTRVDELLQGAPESLKIICVELVEGATSLIEFEHPDQAYYIFGPEDATISQSVIDMADDVIYIPTQGCLNLAASVNVVLYDRVAKRPLEKSGDELIRQSRDTNNRVKVKIACENTLSTARTL